MSETISTSIRIDKDLWNDFKSDCAKKDKKVSHVLETLIRKELEREDAPK